MTTTTPENGSDRPLPWAAQIASRQRPTVARFRGTGGHGFAAEHANHHLDRVLGRRPRLVGLDNAANGPDRLVGGVWLQCKYHQSGTRSVAAAFRRGRYRYVMADGTPMTLEVPRDQYASALGALARRIRHGQVPGVNDPADAARYLRPGHVTYEQARNVARPLTPEGLLFDAGRGLPSAAAGAGLAFATRFVRERRDGADVHDAARHALPGALHTGAAVWGSGLLTAQLGRTRPLRAASSIHVVAAATLLAGSVQGAVQVAQGRSTGAQLLRDTGVAAIGTAAGTVSAVLIASAVSSPLGGVMVLAGSAVAGQLATALGEAILGRMIRNDRHKLLSLINAVIDTLEPTGHDQNRLRAAALAALQPQVRAVLTARDAQEQVRVVIASLLAAPRPTEPPRCPQTPRVRRRAERREPRPWG